jgi:hypothetical protein
MFPINTDIKLKNYAFPSIGQYANVIATVNRKCTYIGDDENGDPIYDKMLGKPTLKFVGTTKLHGTNAGVVFDFHNKQVYYESRESILTAESDNAGFANYMISIQNQFTDMVMNFLETHPDEPDMATDWSKNVLVIYGEWCGGSIQKGVALTGLEKMFVILNATIRTRENTESRNNKWFGIEDVKQLKLTDKKIHNIYDFPTWEIEVDFEKHHEVINKLIEMTVAVEDECPVAKQFGSIGTGEGIVFICITPGYNNSDFWFKSKGEKHAKSKVKTLRPVDNEKINRLIDLAEKITPSWRLEQMFNETFKTQNNTPITREKLGDYIKAVNNDICKEEMLTLEEAGVQFKEVVGYVSKITRDYFFQMELELASNIV